MKFFILEAHNAQEVKQAQKLWHEKGFNSPFFQKWFNHSKVVDEKGQPLVVHHGTKRADRIGNRFVASRATSGPMAYFTGSMDIASKYATGKADTSIETPDDYSGWFKYKVGPRSFVDLDRIWYFLSMDQKQKLSQKLPHVGEDEETNKLIYDPNEYFPMDKGGWEYNIKAAKGNLIKAAKEIWLASGALYDNEEKFVDILDMAGLKGVEFDSPYKEQPGVYSVFLSIQNPLYTYEIDQKTVDALKQKAKHQRAPRTSYGADQWDKRLRDPKGWIEELESGIAKGENSFVWTSIPDWVTNTLKELGYDGIIDQGGKMGGDSHVVYIPFYPWQIKSATGNRGTFDHFSPNITY